MKNIEKTFLSTLGRPVKTGVKKLLWPYMSKPWDTPTMEFDYGLWLGLSALMSQSGRQLGEENTWPARLNLHIPAETTACNFQGNRNRKHINLSALAIAMKHFDKALAICSAVRQVHCQGLPKSRGPGLGIWDIYIISRSCLALIAFMKRSKAAPEPMDDVPDELTSIYQFVSGLFMIAREMMEAAHPAAVENRQMSAQELYHYADSEGIFESPDGMVCAGSTRKILEFLEVFDIGGRDAWPEAEFDLQDLVGSVEDWHKYAISTIELEWFILRKRLENDMARQPENASQQQKVRAVYDDAASYLLDLFPLALPNKETSPQEAACLRQNQILALLGRPGVTRLKADMVKKKFGLG